MTAALKAVELDDPLESHVRAMLTELGADLARGGLRETPERYAKALRFLTGGYAVDPAAAAGNGVFPAEGTGPVVLRDVDFHSLCEHHLLPFHGRIHVGYLPDRRIIGLSKIPRIVDVFSRRFQVQERLTEQVADALMELLAPRGVVVVAEAQHMCMAMRGVRKQGSSTLTRATRGEYAELLTMMPAGSVL